MNTAKEYLGWSNYETWNVALWIGNDELLYQTAKRYRNEGYKAFAENMRHMLHDDKLGFETPDNVSWKHPSLAVDELDNFIKNL